MFARYSISALIVALLVGCGGTAVPRDPDGGASDPADAGPEFHVPQPPTDVQATPGNKQATVTWTAPSNTGGKPVLLYTVIASPGGKETEVTTTTATVTGLTNGTSYTFTVIATNAIGASALSEFSNAVTPSTRPGAPTNVVASRGDGQATITWTAPSDGGNPITGYRVVSNPGGVEVTSTATTATVTGLTNGTSYAFTVFASNVVGESVASHSSNLVVPAGVPKAPTILTVLAEHGEAWVVFSTADDNGAPITGYTVTATPGDFSVTVGPEVTSVDIAGLTNGATYSFVVFATNELGDGTPSVAELAKPVTYPSEPLNVKAVQGNGKATVSWELPLSDGGSVITDYGVTVKPGGSTLLINGFSSSATIPGLTNGTSYTFEVYAINEKGFGSYSVESNPVVPAAAPGAPTITSVEAGNAQVTLSWAVPTSGGAPISGYTIVASSGATYDVAASETTKVITGLTNGTAYTFRVRARNAAGDGTLSAASSSVTPATVPDAPTEVKASSDNSKVYVIWKTPAKGGSPITSYTVTATPGDVVVNVFGASATQATFTDLPTGDGVSYNFTVVAKNAIGSSSPASSNLLPRPCGSISFTEKGRNDAADAPTDVAVADLNGDGHLDVVAAHATRNTVSVMLGSGDGSLGSAASVTTPGQPTIIGVGDFTGDSKPDIAVSNYDLGSVSILTNDGSGGFSVTSTAVVVSKVSNGTVGDVNGDGWLDLIVGTRGTGANTISVMVNNKNGTFGTLTLLTLSGGPDALRLGDLDGDGILDLVAAATSSATVQVYRGKGTGSFDPPVSLVGPSYTNNVTLADLNGDAKLDIIVDTEQAPGSLTTWLNQGNGTFPQTGTKRSHTSSGVFASDAVDLNGDGWIDGFAGLSGGQFSTFYGVGDGTLRTPTDIASTTSTKTWVVGDFNGDGRSDVVVNTASGMAGMSVYLNTCNP